MEKYGKMTPSAPQKVENLGNILIFLQVFKINTAEAEWKQRKPMIPKD